MSDPVDPDALAEAVDLLTDGDLLKRISRHSAAEFVEAVAEVSAAACAVLESPTAVWCEAHDAQKDRDLPDGKWCDWADGDQPCRFGRVRLVAESQPDQPT